MIELNIWLRKYFLSPGAQGAWYKFYTIPGVEDSLCEQPQMFEIATIQMLY